MRGKKALTETTETKENNNKKEVDKRKNRT